MDCGAYFKYVSDKINVNINGTDYMLPVDVYTQWEKQMPEVKSRKFRAESFVLWNTDTSFSKKFIPTPNTSTYTPKTKPES